MCAFQKGNKSLKQKFEKRMKLKLLQRNAAIRTTCLTHVRSRPRLLGYKISVDVKNIFNLVRQKILFAWCSDICEITLTYHWGP